MKRNLLIIAPVFLLLFFACADKKSNWTAQNRADFINGCMQQQTQDSLASQTEKKEICDCLQKKFEEKYPDFSNASKASFEDMNQFGTECLHESAKGHK